MALSDGLLFDFAQHYCHLSAAPVWGPCVYVCCWKVGHNNMTCCAVSVAVCLMQSPAAYASPESAVCVRLLVKLMSDYLNELTYPAELAGLSYSISSHLAGFQVRLPSGADVTSGAVGLTVCYIFARARATLELV